MNHLSVNSIKYQLPSWVGQIAIISYSNRTLSRVHEINQTGYTQQLVSLHIIASLRAGNYKSFIRQQHKITMAKLDRPNNHFQ